MTKKKLRLKDFSIEMVTNGWKVSLWHQNWTGAGEHRVYVFVDKEALIEWLWENVDHGSN